MGTDVGICGLSGGYKQLNSRRVHVKELDKDAITGLLHELGWEYTVLMKPPPSYDYAAAIKDNRIIVLLHKNGDIVELQYTTRFVDTITKRFFEKSSKERDMIAVNLKKALVGADVRHKILIVKEKSFFGFSLSVYLKGDPTKADMLNGSYRMLEIKDLVEIMVAHDLLESQS